MTLYDITNENPITRDAKMIQGLVEYLTGRAYEGSPTFVFLLAGSLSYKHDLRVGGAFSEHLIARIPAQIAQRAGVHTDTNIV